MTYKNKLVSGAQCNSLQQFSHFCTTSPFIHLPSKLISLIFPIFLKWKFPSEVTSIILSYFCITSIPLERGWPELSTILQMQTRLWFMQQQSIPYIPFVLFLFKPVGPSAHSLGELLAGEPCIFQSMSVLIRSRISQCSSQNFHLTCWKHDSPSSSDRFEHLAG